MKNIKFLHLWLGAFFVFLFDQLTKTLAVTMLPFDQEFILNKFISLHVICNESTLMANVDFNISNDLFGIFYFKLFYLFSCVGIFYSIYMVTTLKEYQKETFVHEALRTGLFLIVGSTFGNAFDRIFRSGVIDFFRVNNTFGDSALIMNFADIALYFGEASIVLAIIVYLYYFLFRRNEFKLLFN